MYYLKSLSRTREILLRLKGGFLVGVLTTIEQKHSFTKSKIKSTANTLRYSLLGPSTQAEKNQNLKHHAMHRKQQKSGDTAGPRKLCKSLPPDVEAVEVGDRPEAEVVERKITPDVEVVESRSLHQHLSAAALSSSTILRLDILLQFLLKLLIERHNLTVNLLFGFHHSHVRGIYTWTNVDT